MTPRYKHDCTKCVFLGQHHEYDLYFCTGVERTPVVRRGDDPEDYVSGSIYWPDKEEIRVALTLAAHRGLLQQGDRYLAAVMAQNPDAREALQKYLRPECE